MALLKDLLVTGDARVAGTVYGKGLVYSGEGEVNSVIPVNADTLNGYTAAQIIAAAEGSGGSTTAGGNVSYESAASSISGTTVKLISATGAGTLIPQTTIAAVSGLESRLTTIENNISSGSGNSGTVPTNVVTFVKSSTAPTGAIGVIWFDTSHPTTNRCYIKIWNGVSWEVVNSWQ